MKSLSRRKKKTVSTAINEQDRQVLEITLLKFLGSERDKAEWLRGRGWAMRPSAYGIWDHIQRQGRFYTEWKTMSEAFDCEIKFILTGSV